MKILNIEFIYLMLVPSIFLLYLIITNKSEIERVFDKDLLRRIRIDLGLEKNFKIFLLFFALFLMIFAMARPVIEKGEVEIKSKRSSAIMALDISRSMLAKDFYPDRLTFSKEKIKKFIEKLKNVDIAIIAFSKEAFILSPITSDKETALFLLKKLDTKYITLQGTNILAAIEAASKLSKNQEKKDLIIFTDGGDKKDFQKEIDLSKKYNIKVSIFMVASKNGAPIPENGGFLKDKNGNLVITRKNTNIEKLAKETGGVFIDAALGNKDIDEVINRLKFKKLKIKKEKILDVIELSLYFMGFALFLLSLVFFSFSKKSKLIKVVLISIFPYYLHSGILDFKDIKMAKEYYKSKKYKQAIEYFKKVAKSKKSAQSYYALANAYYKAKNFKEAIKYYNMVQTPNRELERYKLHNLGNCYFKLKNYKKAIEFYKKALGIKEDKDTRLNLELAKKMVEKSRKSSGKNSLKNKKEKKNKKGKQGTKKEQEDSGKKGIKKSGSGSKKEKNLDKKIKSEPISEREEKKWIKQIEKNSPKTLLYKIPTKHKGIEVEKPW